MTNTKILFYILIPVYKVEKYIRQCIDSVLNQSYSNFNLVIVDDGSPDKSGEICEQYAHTDERITIIHQENMGLIAARQTAVKYVRENNKDRSAYIVYLDSDDYLEENSLEKISNIIESSSAELVMYGYQRVSEGKVVQAYDYTRDSEGEITDKRTLYRIVLFDDLHNCLCTKAVSVRLIEDPIDYSKLYHISHGEDLLQSLPFYRDCNKAYLINEPLYNYRVNPASITNDISNVDFCLNFELDQIVMDFVNSENVFNGKDKAEFLACCSIGVASKIKNVVSSNNPVSKKYEYLTSMFTSSYFMTYLYKKDKCWAEKSWASAIYKLFEKHKFYNLILIGALIRLKRKLAK